jgi:ribosome maturation factor RimP
MSVEQKIREILEDKFQDEEFKDCFLMDVFQKKNKIEVFADSDSGMTFEKCKKISRFLENYLDENDVLKDPYTLEVSSPGIDAPLKFERQYIKNVGRKIELTDKEGNQFLGKLETVENNHIVIEFEKTFKEGNKKKKVLEKQIIPFANIQKAIIKITF